MKVLLEKFIYSIKYVIENYDYVIHDLGDTRIKNWFPISSPLPTLIIIGTYLLLIYKLLPRCMEGRKPFYLKNTIFCYNIFQIISCIILVYQLVTPLSQPAYVWQCENFVYSEDPISLKRLTLSYYFYFLKLVELVETVFFILRKKFNQVSALHVYHHITTLSMAWFYAKYFAGGMVSFCMMLNSSVHVFMYSYYLLASLGPRWQKKVISWKPVLTSLQMIQLFVLIAHSSQVLFNKKCGLPHLTFYCYAPNVAIMLYMFKNFYTKQYSQDAKQKLKNL